MALPRTAAFRTFFRSQSARTAGARASSRVSSRCQQLGRRSYASQGGHDSHQKSSDLPWAAAAVAITAPSAYFLLNSGAEKVPHGHEKEQVPKSVSEPEPKEEPKEEAAAPEPEPEAPKEEAKEEPKEEKKPSEIDEPGAAKTVDGAGKTPAMTSGKQEGLDNANTSSPFTTDPGKSVKGEQDVETAKLKGTVDPERPQV